MTTTTYGGRTFDRVERVDPRSFNHLLAASSIYISREDRVLLAAIAALDKRVTALEASAVVAPTPPPPPAPPAATLWACGEVLDQQRTGMCVGYAWAAYAMSSPSPYVIVPGIGGDDETSTPDAIYDEAQIDDGSAADPDTGASTTGGANAARKLGFARSYVWALNVEQLVAGVVRVGPAVCGVPWRSTMMDPDAHGVLDVGDKSQNVGGHEILLCGYFPPGAPGNPSAVDAMFGARQSWGTGWGLGGDYFIPVAGFADLFADGADATIPTK